MFKNCIREQRKKKGLSQLEVMRKSGIAPNIISDLERGRLYPYPGWRKRLAIALDVDEKILFPEVKE